MAQAGRRRRRYSHGRASRAVGEGVTLALALAPALALTLALTLPLPLIRPLSEILSPSSEIVEDARVAAVSEANPSDDLED